MRKKIIIAFFVLIAVLVSVSFLYKNSNNKEIIINTNPEVNTLVVADSFENKVLPLSDTYAKFDVKYPSFKNADINFNFKIENLLKAQMQDFKNTSVENWQARFNTQAEGDNISKIPADADKFTFSSDYNVVQSNANYISFVLHYGGFDGGAHGFENVVSYNYDIKKQKEIQLADLFSNNQNYLNDISVKSRTYLKDKYASFNAQDIKDSDLQATKDYFDNMISMIESGTEPKIDNFSTFTFTPNKIKIYFADYQVGPHSIGMPEFEFDR
ncbi:MAG: DUF4163 domain-containing protein [bacterium]